MTGNGHVIFMYIRFAGFTHVPEVGVSPGLFWISTEVPREGDWRHDELSRVRGWFNDHLDAPDLLEQRLGRRGLRQGVCWFRDTARQHIAQARYMAWLLTELGAPVRELRAEQPGHEIWRDQYQVVFVPLRDRIVQVV